MVIEIIVYNTNSEKFIVSNSKGHELINKNKQLSVHIKRGAFIDTTFLIEEFETTEQCNIVYQKIKDFIKKRKEIKEVIQLTLKDIKDSKTQEEKNMYEKFLWNRESEFLKYDNLYIKDLLKT